MNLIFDEFGRPLLIVKRKKKSQPKNSKATKSNIAAANALISILRSSFGPRGMDKLIQDGDGNVTITNDGATILDKVEIHNQIGKIIVQLSKSQDDEIGDGTTGVTLLAAALLETAEPLIDMGIHPSQISEGYDNGCTIAVEHLKKIATSFDFSDTQVEPLVKICMTSLSPKIVKKCKRPLGEICVRALLAVADVQRHYVNLELIKIECKAGGKLEDVTLVNGIVLDKAMSHSQMKKKIEDPKIAVLTCAFEPPRPKTKHQVQIKSASEFEALYEIEQNYFVHMIEKIKKLDVNMVFCQWGFDDEANHLLMHDHISAIRWVGGVEIELIAIATGAKITPRFQELSLDKIGCAKMIRELGFGTSQEKVTFIEGCPRSRSVTIFVRGGCTVIVDEIKRSIHDALCAAKNLLCSNIIVYGGGGAELSISLQMGLNADHITGVKQFTLRAYAHALEQIPAALAENSGLNSVELITVLKARQLGEKNPYLGIDCTGGTNYDMRKNNVFEALAGKKQQLSSATQACRMILKIHDNCSDNSGN